MNNSERLEPSVATQPRITAIPQSLAHAKAFETNRNLNSCAGHLRSRYSRRFHRLRSMARPDQLLHVKCHGVDLRLEPRLHPGPQAFRFKLRFHPRPRRRNQSRHRHQLLGLRWGPQHFMISEHVPRRGLGTLRWRVREALDLPSHHNEETLRMLFVLEAPELLGSAGT